MNRTWIVSDVHLGSRFCRSGEFLVFLRQLTGDGALILNGDIVDHFRDSRAPQREAAMAALRDVAAKMPVTWVAGNNDRLFRLPDAPSVRYAEEEVVAGRFLVCHGHRFEPSFRRNPLLVFPVRAMYWAYRSLSRRPMHPAAFAKILKAAYRAFTNHVAREACEESERRGIETVICGHTHLADDRKIGRVRYINTGCWTETVPHAAVIDSTGPRLVAARGGWTEP